MDFTILNCKKFIDKQPLTQPVEIIRNVTDYELDIELADGKQYKCNKSLYTLTRGDIVFRKPGDKVHFCGNMNSYILTLDFSQTKQTEGYSRNVFQQTQPLTSSFLLNDIPCVLHTKNPSAFIEIYSKLSQLPNQNCLAGYHLVMQLLFLINSEINKQAYENIQSNKLPCDLIFEYLKDNLNKTVTLNELSSIFHLEKSYLSRIFKKKFNKTPIDMHIDLKMDNALNLIVNTDMRICDVALNCGYNTTSFFIAEYKKRYGLTPIAYRKNFRK